MAFWQLLVFLGAPGSGKGSLSHMCVERLGWIQLSTGDLCRKHMAEGTAIGKQIDFAMKSGTLVSDDLIIDMVVEWLREQQMGGKTIIFDGFPRTVAQAEKFFDILKTRYPHIAVHVVELNVPDEELLNRLSSRLVCSNKSCQRVYSERNEALKPKVHGICDVCQSALIQRFDDSPETVKNRLQIYHKHAGGLKQVCKKEGFNVEELDGTLPSQELFEILKREYGRV